MRSAVGYIANICGNAVSCAACIWLVRKFYHFRKLRVIARRQNFFSYLFWSMAAVDVLFHLGLANYAAVRLFFKTWPQSPDLKASACVAAWAVFAPSRAISAFHELAIAAYVLCAAFRCRVLLLVLGRSIPLLWVAGGGLGVASVFWNPWMGSDRESMCTHASFDFFTFGIILLCFGLSVVAYLCVAVRAAYWEPVMRRRFMRLSIYPLIFFLTYVTIMIVYTIPGMYQPGPIFFFADFMESLNGLLNVVSYWYQSYYVAQLQLFGVNFGIEILSTNLCRPAGPTQGSAPAVADGLNLWARRLEAMTREHAAVERYVRGQEGELGESRSTVDVFPSTRSEFSSTRSHSAQLG